MNHMFVSSISHLFHSGFPKLRLFCSIGWSVFKVSWSLSWQGEHQGVRSRQRGVTGVNSRAPYRQLRPVCLAEERDERWQGLDFDLDPETASWKYVIWSLMRFAKKLSDKIRSMMNSSVHQLWSRIHCFHFPIGRMVSKKTKCNFFFFFVTEWFHSLT